MGGSTQIEQPTPPSAPSVTSSMEDYIKNYPALFSLMQQYMPQEAQMQVGLAQKYAQPLGQAYKTAQEAMYPQETQITNALNQQVQQGMGEQLPDWARQSYMDTMRSQLGENALSGVGADYMSTGLLEQQKSWQDYYRNLGLSITGRQPIATAQTPQTTNQLTGYTPQGVMNYNASTYSPYASAYSSMYGTNQQQAQANQQLPFQYMSGIGNLMSGVGSMGQGGLLKSAKRLKKNIRLWVKH